MKYKTIYVLSVLSLSIMMAACGKNTPEVVSDTVANVEETEVSGEGTEMSENKEMPVLEYLQEIKNDEYADDIVFDTSLVSQIKDVLLLDESLPSKDIDNFEQYVYSAASFYLTAMEEGDVEPDHIIDAVKEAFMEGEFTAEIEEIYRYVFNQMSNDNITSLIRTYLDEYKENLEDAKKVTDYTQFIHDNLSVMCPKGGNVYVIFGGTIVMAQDSYGNPITNINNIALDYEFIGRYNGVQFYRITDTVNGTTYTVSIKNEQEYGITADRSSAAAIEYMPDLSGIAEELTEAEISK